MGVAATLFPDFKTFAYCFLLDVASSAKLEENANHNPIYTYLPTSVPTYLRCNFHTCHCFPLVVGSKFHPID